MLEWFVVRGEERHGPYTVRELCDFMAEGRVDSRDLLWRQGLEKPLPARQLRRLLDEEQNAEQQMKPVRATKESDVPLVPKPAIPERKPWRAGLKRESSRPESVPPAPQEFTAFNAPAAPQREQAPESGTSKSAALERAERESFGQAFLVTSRASLESFAAFVRHPIRYTFATFVLVAVCMMSIPPLVTILLTPVFVLGYLEYLRSMLSDRPASFATFLSFMRHGWDSLWHLLMLLASFFIAAALAIVPIYLVIITLWFVTATIGLGAAQVGSLLPEIHVGVPAERVEQEANPNANRQPWRPFKEQEPPKENFFTHAGKAILSLGDAGLRLVAKLAAAILLSILLIPWGVILVLTFCLGLGTITARPQDSARYDLVYQSFEQMLAIAKTRWKVLAISGLRIAASFVLSALVLETFSELMKGTYLVYLSEWILLVALPVVFLTLSILTNLFAVRLAMDLIEDCQAARTPFGATPNRR